MHLLTTAVSERASPGSWHTEQASTARSGAMTKSALIIYHNNLMTTLKLLLGDLDGVIKTTIAMDF